MKNLLVLMASLFLLGCVIQHPAPTTSTSLPVITTRATTSTTTSLAKCGLQECHGISVTCGSNVPEVCTADYELGDKCRAFASCQVISGNCQLVTTSKFDVCKSCVENCLSQFQNDAVKASQCEATCGEAPKVITNSPYCKLRFYNDLTSETVAPSVTLHLLVYGFNQTGNKVVWSSSNTNVADVSPSSGSSINVNALKPGYSVITATDTGLNDTCSITFALTVQ